MSHNQKLSAEEKIHSAVENEHLYGCTKKADKLAALRAAGFSTVEAAQLYNKIG